MNMESLKFNKSFVVEKLKENRAEHVKIVKEAQKGYREKAIEIYKEKLKLLEGGKSVDANTYIQIPVSHIDDFDRTIEMLEMSVEDVVSLDQGQYQQYVRNRWNWQGQFLASNSAYSVTALVSGSLYNQQ